MSCAHRVFKWEIVGHLVSPCNAADSRPVDVQALRWARQLWVHMLQPANEFSIQCVSGNILHGSQAYSRRVGHRSSAQCACASCQASIRERSGPNVPGCWNPIERS